MQLPVVYRGRVVPGRGRGRRLGFPTLNFKLPKKFPAAAYGVYACWVWAEGEWRAGVAHLGPAVSFGEKIPMLEVHILGWSGTLRDQKSTVQLVEKIRDSITFSRLRDFTRQLAVDVSDAKRRLRPAVAPSGRARK